MRPELVRKAREDFAAKHFCNTLPGATTLPYGS
jgi:hypothetical protein